MATGHWYSDVAKKHPVMTAVITTGLKTSAADLFAQKVRLEREFFSFFRAFFVVFCSSSSAPMSASSVGGSRFVFFSFFASLDREKLEVANGSSELESLLSFDTEPEILSHETPQWHLGED